MDASGKHERNFLHPCSNGGDFGVFFSQRVIVVVVGEVSVEVFVAGALAAHVAIAALHGFGETVGVHSGHHVNSGVLEEPGDLWVFDEVFFEVLKKGNVFNTALSSIVKFA